MSQMPLGRSVLKSERGIALVTVMGFSVVFALIVIGLFRFLNSTTKGNTNLSEAEKLTEFAMNFKKRAQNIDDCSHLMYPGSFQVLGANFNTANAKSNVILNYDGLLVSSTAGQNVVPGTNIKIKSVYLKAVSPTPAANTDPGTQVIPALSPGGGNAQRFRSIRLQLVIEPQDFQWNYNKDQNKVILKFYYYRQNSSTNILQSCFVEDSSAATCELGGGYPVPIYFNQDIGLSPNMLNPASGLPKNLYSCQPQTRCFYNAVSSGAYTGNGDCILPYRPEPFSNLWYRCSWCNPNN